MNKPAVNDPSLTKLYEVWKSHPYLKDLEGQYWKPEPLPMVDDEGNVRYIADIIVNLPEALNMSAKERQKYGLFIQVKCWDIGYRLFHRLDYERYAMERDINPNSDPDTFNPILTSEDPYAIVEVAAQIMKQNREDLGI